ncbi:cobalamin biosynthesis protein CbiL [uncultured Cohaesibacter sp.]|uniref:cobalamin biosynthesis protein CbiL n=1 Tax=uncultured Cohaesibacter sp. TaxID=1002546 RepID=UPI002AAB52E5|nr:cobalamin biosynthesis protein CbiL [uncultured Cohaesibacter sp.]
MMRFLFIALASLALFANPANAHKLKVFATVKGDHIAGYAFFIGGGRAQGTNWVAKDAAGAVVAEGTTDMEGNYDFIPPKPAPSDITITVNTQEGHIASALVAVDRLGGTSMNPPQTGSQNNTLQTSPASQPETAPQLPSASQLEPMIEAAVQRQIEPLLERIEQMDSQMRFTDIISGIFLIIGLAGIGLWARSRR